MSALQIAPDGSAEATAAVESAAAAQMLHPTAATRVPVTQIAFRIVRAKSVVTMAAVGIAECATPSARTVGSAVPPTASARSAVTMGAEEFAERAQTALVTLDNVVAQVTTTATMYPSAIRETAQPLTAESIVSRL